VLKARSFVGGKSVNATQHDREDREDLYGVEEDAHEVDFKALLNLLDLKVEVVALEQDQDAHE